MAFFHFMPGFPVFHSIKENGKIVTLRVQLAGRNLEFYPFVIDPLFLALDLDAQNAPMVSCLEDDAGVPLRVDQNAVPDLKTCGVSFGDGEGVFSGTFSWKASGRDTAPVPARAASSRARLRIRGGIPSRWAIYSAQLSPACPCSSR